MVLKNVGTTFIVILFLVESAFAEEDKVKLYLYTPSNQTAGVRLVNSTLSAVNRSLDTKIVIHGFFENANRYWLQHIREAYFKRGNYNIILVDWSYWATWRPFSAIDNIPTVGKTVADVVVQLITSYGINASKIHILGFSMGAHAAGYAGQDVYASLGKKIGRITGLDAVGQYYSNLNDSQRLSADDADFVDAVHTSWIGRYDAYGHIDFYVNGRYHQKGCPDIFVNGRNTTIIDILINLVTCSHERSHAYYMESINCDGFIGVKCNNESSYDNGLCDGNAKAVFGEAVPLNTSGSYYLITHSNPSFNIDSC